MQNVRRSTLLHANKTTKKCIRFLNVGEVRVALLFIVLGVFVLCLVPSVSGLSILDFPLGFLIKK